MTPAQVIVSRLESVRGGGPKWMARCPAHDDKSPSLSIRALDDGRVLLHCFGGCEAGDVLASIGLTLANLYPDGPVGEFMAKTHRAHENRLYRGAFVNMEQEINRLRARLSAK